LTTRVLVRSIGPPDQTLELEGLVNAAFWIGMEHGDDEVRSVTVTADPASFSTEGPGLQELITLLIRREIDFSIDFLPEGRKKSEYRSPGGTTFDRSNKGHGRELGYLEELAELKKALDQGRLTKSQYEENRKILIGGWVEREEEKKGGR
jgi:hypothetical protein